MRLNRFVVMAATLSALGGAALFAGCGGNSGTSAGGSGDGGGDGESADGTVDTGSSSGSNEGGSDSATKDSGKTGDSGSKSDGGGPSDASLSPDVFGGGDSGCVTLGSACTTGGECCTGTCTGGACTYPACGQTDSACTSNGQCCTQTCTTGACATISTCSTLGLSCTSSGQCCSGNCASNGTCQPSSFCSQTGDICAAGNECCSGICTIPSGKSIGTCAAATPGGNCTAVDGQLCTAVSSLDGGCGGNCCSRACGPWGPTGINICQPATGCHVEHDTCTTDSDCCGSPAFIDGGLGDPQHPVHCVGGYCTQHMGCAPNGDVCKLMTTSCNANQDCCAGRGNSRTPCKQDNVGVPRCANVDCGDGGTACATSADCCNGLPCVPNPIPGGPPFVCANTQCVPSCAGCTTTADCCPGFSCIGGVCDPCGGSNPDGGTGTDGGGHLPDGGVCSAFGQLCDKDAGVDCCVGLSCLSGRCLN